MPVDGPGEHAELQGFIDPATLRSAAADDCVAAAIRIACELFGDAVGRVAAFERRGVALARDLELPESVGVDWNPKRPMPLLRSLAAYRAEAVTRDAAEGKRGRS